MDIISSELLNDLNKQLNETVPQFALDGKFHHFKNGKPEPSSSHVWACGHSWEFKGNTYQYVTAGDWRDGSRITIKSYERDKISRAANKAASDHIRKIEETKKEEQEKNYKACREKWNEVWRGLGNDSPTHPYLVFKKSNSNYRARVRYSKTLIVPIEKPGRGLVGVQQIFKPTKDKSGNPIDPEKSSFLKIFSKGIEIHGAFTRITNFDLQSEKLIYLAEGFATATSIYQATKKPVVCCFTGSNIIPAIVSIRSVNPNIKIIVAGDNDHENKKNWGKIYAEKASKQFSNVISRLPTFEDGNGLSDFNDLHVCESIEKVSNQLTVDINDFMSIICLGHNSGSYFYVNTQTSEIFKLKPPEHTPANLLSQATSKYWGQRYRFKKDKEGSPTSKPDWDTVVEQLFVEQRQAGIFSNDNIRGYGAWYDNGQVILNAGKNLYIYSKDGEVAVSPITEHKLNTKYIYEANKAIAFNPTEKLSRNELDDIIKCFSLASYKNTNDFIYIVGFLAIAQFPGICPWRGHNWLTGSRGVGKTTFLSWICELCYDQGTIQDPTPAGLRQEISSNTLPIFIDETEPNSPDAKRRLGGMLDIARQCSSPNASRSIRGTADGNAQSFLISAIFMFSSIQVSIKNAADLSRFTVIELKKNSRENYDEMRKIAAKFPEYSKKLLAYMLSESHNYLANFETVKEFILDEYTDLDSRQADQISTLVAGYYAIKHGGLVDEFKLSMIMAQLNVQSSQYVEDNKETDEEKCLDAILDAISSGSRHSIKYMISQTDEHNTGENGIYLQDLGIKVYKKYSDTHKEIFIQSNSTALKKAISDTEFEDYSKVLKRSKYIVDSRKTTRIHGVMKRGIVIDLNLSDQIPIKVEDDLEVPF